MDRPLKLAAAQLAPVYLDREATTKKAVAAIAEAGDAGADLIAFPETYLPGYPYWAMLLDPVSINGFHARLFRESVQVPGPTIDTLCQAAKKAEIHVVMGLNEVDGGTMYNSQAFIGADGTLLGKRRKLVPTSHERLVWGRGSGNDLEVVQTELGTVGGLICYEHSNALYRYALQAQREEIHIAGWPGGVPIDGIIDAAVRHYAFEAQTFVVSVTSVLDEACLEALGTEGKLGSLKVGGGASTIVDPRGTIIAGPVPDKEVILYADADPALIPAAKSIVDSAGHYARPDVVQLLWHRQARAPLVVDGTEAEPVVQARTPVRLN